MSNESGSSFAVGGLGLGVLGLDGALIVGGGVVCTVGLLMSAFNPALAPASAVVCTVGMAMVGMGVLLGVSQIALVAALVAFASGVLCSVASSDALLDDESYGL